MHNNHKTQLNGGISTYTMGKMYKDEPVSLDAIMKICQVFHCDIDEIVKTVRFDGWQDTGSGRREVKKALRSVVAIKYKIKDTDVFDKAYSYIEMYY